MQFFLQSRTGFFVLVGLTAIPYQSAPAQESQSKDAQVRELKGIPPRATPADYQAQAQAGTVTVAAEFKGHSVPTPEAVLSSEDFVVVEVGLYGPPEARLKLSHDDFSLRVNGKKAPLPALPYAGVFRSLKDPEWIPPGGGESKSSKTSIGGGGKGAGDGSSLPVVVHVPIELERAMQQHVRKASLPEGERVLPEAGLIFFEYRGKASGIHSIELMYTGPLGKATLNLQP